MQYGVMMIIMIIIINNTANWNGNGKKHYFTILQEDV